MAAIDPEQDLPDPLVYIYALYYVVFSAIYSYIKARSPTTRQPDILKTNPDPELLAKKGQPPSKTPM